MADMNRASLFGRLGKDPEIRTMESGDKVASFSFATGEKWKDRNTGEDRERTEWHQIVVFGPLVNVVEKWLKKGRRAYIEGAIRTRKWQDKDGNDRWSTEIVLSGFGARLDLIDFEDSSGGAQKGREDSYGSLPGAQGGGYGAGQGYGGGGRPDLDDEVPFAPEWRI